jgi:hypothetical protein
MTPNRVDDHVRATGDPVTIHIGSARLETAAVPLGEGEFLVPRDLGVSSGAHLRWRDRCYIIGRVEGHQLGCILHTVEVNVPTDNLE